jgi:hypothetical protein
LTVKKALVDISGDVTEENIEAKVKMYLARQWLMATPRRRSTVPRCPRQVDLSRRHRLAEGDPPHVVAAQHDSPAASGQFRPELAIAAAS